MKKTDFNDGYYSSNQMVEPLNIREGDFSSNRTTSLLGGRTKNEIAGQTRKDRVGTIAVGFNQQKKRSELLRRLSMTGSKLAIMGVFLLSFLPFIAKAQTFTPITLPYNNSNCELVQNGGSGDYNAYFKVTLTAENHLYFRVDKFMTGGSQGPIEYGLFYDQAMTNRVVGGGSLYSFEYRRGEDVVTPSLPIGDYYLRWRSSDYSNFAWTMEAISPTNIKDYKLINYTTSLVLGKNEGTLARAMGTQIVFAGDPGEPEKDAIMLGNGFSFNAEGGKRYKFTSYLTRKNPNDWYGEVEIVFLSSGTLSGIENDIRGQISLGKFGSRMTTSAGVDYFIPNKTETLRALMVYSDINDEVAYSIQIEEATPPPLTLTFEEFPLPYDQPVTFEANNSTYYEGERFKGYKFTLVEPATVYFYGENNVYAHQPTIRISPTELSFIQWMRLSPIGETIELVAGDYYVAVSDGGFTKDDYFTTQLVITTNAQEAPTGTSPTIGNPIMTPLLTLLNDAPVVSLPYTIAGSFDKAMSALVPTQNNPQFRPGSFVGGSYFSLARKVTVEEGDFIVVNLKYERRKNTSSSAGIQSSVHPQLWVYQSNESTYTYVKFGSGDMSLSAAGTYYIVATSDSPFEWGDYRLQIYKKTDPPAKPEIISVAITPVTTIAITPNTAAVEKQGLLTQLTVKGNTTDHQSFTLPNMASRWSIVGDIATYTPVANDEYTIQTGITSAVTFVVPTTTYTATFYSNGGSGTMSPQTIYAGESLTPCTFTKSGQTIGSWNTEATGNGTTYMNGQVVNLTDNLTLYAIWADVINLPTLTLGSVTNITTRTATLHATIVPETTTPVEYGFIVNGRFYSVTPLGNILTYQLTNLDGSNNYDVEAYYIHNGVTYISVGYQSFQTLRAETDIGDISVREIASTSATFMVEVDEGAEELILQRKFRYRLQDTDLGGWGNWIDITNVVIGTSSFTATATDLTPAAYYEVRAVITVTGDIEKTRGTSFNTLAAGVIPATVTTTDATDITQTTAMLHGNIVAGGQELYSGRFEYREVGNSYWYHKVLASVEEGHVSINLTGLGATTAYEFRLMIQTDNGYIYGTILRFTTLGSNNNATATTKAATAVLQTTATLNGSYTAGTQTVTNPTFEYKKVTDGNWSTIVATGTTTVTASLTALTASTDYQFRLVVTANGIRKEGNVVMFTTLAVGVTPATVTTAAASNITKNSATLNGSYTAGTQTVTNPTFEYKKVADGTWSTIAAAGTTTVTASLTALTASTDYQFRLVITANGIRKEGNTVVFRAPSENYVEQTVAVSVATAITKNSATLNGTVTAGSEPITDRGFEYKVKTASSWQRVSQTSNGSITANITGLMSDTEYDVRVYAITGTATVYSNVVSFKTEKDATGIFDLRVSELKLYPNPATTLLNIENIRQTNALLVDIFDIMGRLVLQVPSAEVIDVSALPQGIYTVKAGNYTARIIKN